jgi:hypothetical protein
MLLTWVSICVYLLFSLRNDAAAALAEADWNATGAHCVRTEDDLVAVFGE